MFTPIFCRWLGQIGRGEDYQHPPREIEVLHRKLLERLHTRRDRNDDLLSADLSTNERWENRTCTDAGAVAVAASSIIGRAVDANDNAAPTEQVSVFHCWNSCQSPLHQYKTISAFVCTCFCHILRFPNVLHTAHRAVSAIHNCFHHEIAFCPFFGISIVWPLNRLD